MSRDTHDSSAVLQSNWVATVEADFAKNADKIRPGNYMVCGIDIDGQLRGKFVPATKLKSGTMPFCSVIFGWDLADSKYVRELAVSNADNGYGDVRALVDLSSDFEYPSPALNARMVLAYFLTEQNTPLYTCPRSLLRGVLGRLDGLHAKAGVEIEFYNYAESAGSVTAKGGATLQPLTVGMHGYSVLKPLENGDYWAAILERSANFGIKFDTFHSETGPGVYECALAYDDADTIADQVTLFKFAVRTAGKEKIIPCFMAKPQTGMPGNSGHVHVSLIDNDNRNVFACDRANPSSAFPETEFLSDTGHHFLAGVLAGLEDVMLMFAPNINSYKRLDPEFWAPVTVSWGAENRLASIRLIDAHKSAKACRFEVRIPGADLIPHFALATIFGLGQRGIRNKAALNTPPVRSQDDILNSKKLPLTLGDAIAKFEAPSSAAREIFGNDFVNHYAETRKHELYQSQRAVTDWEIKRYMETA